MIELGLRYAPVELPMQTGVPDEYVTSVLGTRPSLLEIRKDPTYDRIVTRHLLSNLGVHISSQPLRYPDFDYGRLRMLFDHGDDIHPGRHGWQTFQDGRRLICAELGDSPQRTKRFIDNYSPKDIEFSYLMYTLHDLVHESTSPKLGVPTVGDIPHGHKTDKDRDIETGVRRVMWERRLRLGKGTFHYLPLPVIDRLDWNLSHTTPIDNDIKHLYRASHTIGFLERGLAAARIACGTADQLQETDRFKKSHAMSIKVVGETLDLIERNNMTEYAFFDHILDANIRLIDRVLSWGDSAMLSAA